MTDSRVTPQAAAKEREHVALTAATYTLWRYDYRGQSSEWFDAHHPEEWHWERAERALAAAGPLLCQPLQDEIDRLRAAILEAARDIEREKTAYLPDGADHCEVAANAALDLAAWIVRDRLQLPGLVTGR